MQHLYDIPLHRDLQSSARWHGKRVGEAIAQRRFSDASYETAQWRHTSGHWRPIEQADADYIFDHARRLALLAALALPHKEGS